MSLNPKGRCDWRTALILFLSLSVPSVGLAKTKNLKGGGNSDLSGIVRPELANAQTDPTLRFPVMSMSGSITYGWLDITNNTIRYSEVQPTRRANHTFEVSRFAIGNLRFNGTFLTFKSPKKLQMLFYLPQEQWGTVHAAFGGVSKAATRESLGTASIYKTLMNFNGVLALVKPPPPPPSPVIVQPVAPAPPKPVAPPSPPAIVLSSPAGAAEGQTLEMEESTVVIRGVAMDSTGIPAVKINGSPANMRPQTSQAAEFWSDPLPLQEGNNPIQIVASNSAHVDATLGLTVHYKPKTAPVNPRALDKGEILSLLQGGVPVAHVTELVKDRGIKFAPTADDLNDIRAAGGNDELIQAIQQAGPHS